jgi:glycosyltransferase involved in cell wall biosynthesis
MSVERSISAIIAVYNGRRFIADAIRSILDQSVPVLEVCVVDDGSDDGTGEVVAQFSDVSYLHRERNQGQASALNWGVECARGDHLAFLDADDVWMPDKLERQTRAFDEQPELDLVYGLMRERVLGGPASLAGRDGAVRPAPLPSAMLVTRSAFARVGGFDARWTLGSVVDWHARAMELGLRHCILQHVVYERRIHGANVGIQRARHRSDYLEVVKAALDRRRRDAGSGGNA